MILRLCRYNDLQKVLEIDREVFPKPLSRFVYLIFYSLARIAVCEVRGKVVGFLVFGYEDMGTMHIYRIGIARSQQGKGIGSRLLAKYIKGRCSVATQALNKGALGFYMQHGFKVAGHYFKESRKMLYLRNF